MKKKKGTAQTETKKTSSARKKTVARKATAKRTVSPKKASRKKTKKTTQRKTALKSVVSSPRKKTSRVKKLPLNKDIFGVYQIMPRSFSAPREGKSFLVQSENKTQVTVMPRKYRSSRSPVSSPQGSWENLEGFKFSPFLLDLRGKNTAELKELIKKEKPSLWRPRRRGLFRKSRSSSGINLIKSKKKLRWESFFWKNDFLDRLRRFFLRQRDQAVFRKFEERERWGEYWLPFNKTQAVLGFFIFAVLVVLPFWGSLFYKKADQKKGQILGESIKAVSNLEKGKEFLEQADFQKANEFFLLSWENFQKTENNFSVFNSWWGEVLGQFPFLDKIKAGQSLISAGKRMSQAAYYLSSSLGALQAENPLLSSSAFKINGQEVLSFNFNPRYFNNLLAARQDALLAWEEIKGAKKELAQADLAALSEDIREKAEKLQRSLPDFESGIKDYSDFLRLAEGFLGKGDLRRYLIVFQNNYEMRGSGGFIGSFAFVDLANGQIKSIEMPEGGSYDLQGGLTKSISPPLPLYLVTSRWQFHDANWWPDFPTSARKLEQFYEWSGGPSTDGVIAVNPQIIISLLRITGPIALPEYEEIVDADNFMWVAEYNVELEYDREENKPKKFLVDLGRKILERLQEEMNRDPKGTGKKLLSILEKSWAEKDLQFYFQDHKLEEIVKRHSLGGQIKDFTGDYLLVANTNIGGGKTDGVIAQTIELKTEILETGEVIDTLIIKRRHNGNPHDYFQKVRNVDWLRVYVPQGAQLLSAQGFSQVGPEFFKTPDRELETDPDLAQREGVFEIDPDSNTRIYNEFGKTVFANWMMVDVGQEKEVVLRYRLPQKIKFSPLTSYKLLVQKQSGEEPYFYHTFILPSFAKEEWNNLEKNNFQGILERDMVIGRIFSVDRYKK